MFSIVYNRIRWFETYRSEVLDLGRKIPSQFVNLSSYFRLLEQKMRWFQIRQEKYNKSTSIHWSTYPSIQSIFLIITLFHAGALSFINIELFCKSTAIFYSSWCQRCHVFSSYMMEYAHFSESEDVAENQLEFFAIPLSLFLKCFTLASEMLYIHNSNWKTKWNNLLCIAVIIPGPSQ